MAIDRFLQPNRDSRQPESGNGRALESPIDGLIADELALLRKIELWRHAGQMLGKPTNHAVPEVNALNHLSSVLLNNHGGPFKGSGYPLQTHPSEQWVLRSMARLLNLMSAEPLGFIAPGTTVATQHALMKARDLLKLRKHSPRGYCSSNAHHCAKNTFHMLGIEFDEIEACPDGAMDINALADQLNKHGDEGAIIFSTVGTTWKGAVDDVEQLGALLREHGQERSWLHVDAALFGFMFPFLKGIDAWDFRVEEVSSIAVSAHKFLGCPRVAGILLMRDVDEFQQEEWIPYAGSSDLGSLGSRDGIIPIWIRHLLMIVGNDGMAKWAEDCVRLAKFAERRFSECGFNALRSPFSNIVTFDRPRDDAVVEKYHLMEDPEKDPGRAQIFVMPHVRKKHIKSLLRDILDSEWIR